VAHGHNVPPPAREGCACPASAQLAWRRRRLPKPEMKRIVEDGDQGWCYLRREHQDLG